MPYFDTPKKILPPIGLGYIASALEKRGYNVTVKDFQIEYVPMSKAIKQIVDEHYDAIGISTITDNRFNAIELIRQVKQKDNRIFIFVGGPHFSATAIDALKNIREIDVVVRNEGEITACELLDAYYEQRSFESVLGITFRDYRDNIIENPDRPLVNNIDKIEAPAWHLFKMEKYNYSFDDSGLPFIGLMSSRGCPYSCAFCANSTHSIRFRTPSKFVDEIQHLKERYSFEGFIFLDSTFTVNHNHVVQICEEIIKRGLKIKWQAGARVSSVDRKILALMREAGCFRVTYGIESGSEKILKNVNKGIDMQQIREAIHISSELGFDISAFFMVGFPDENLNELKKTIKLIKELDTYKGCKSIYGFTVIYPNTEIEKIAQERNILPKNFSWNTYQIFPKYIFTDTSKTVPYYEDSLKIEMIKFYMIIYRYNFSWHTIKILYTRLLQNLKKIFNRTLIQRT